MTDAMRAQLDKIAELLTETRDGMAQATYLALLARYDPENGEG